jgi:HD superfamily phosphodiesterase
MRLLRVLPVLVAVLIAMTAFRGVTAIVGVGLGVFAFAFAFSPLFEVNAASGHRFNLTFLVGAAVPFFFSGWEAALGALAVGYIAVCAARLTPLITNGDLFGDLRRFLGAALYGAVLGSTGFFEIYAGDGPLAIAIFSAAGFLWMAFDAIWRGVRKGSSVGYELRYGYGDIPLVFALLAAGAVLGVVWLATETWWVALAVGVIPFFMTFSSFRRFDVARGTYEQTILALAKIPEISGLSFSGHAERTADLATDMGVRLHLGPEALRNLRYAALMHDIGRITLNEPSIVARGYTSADLTGWSAEIIAEAAYLESAADVVRVHHRPYRSPGEKADEDVPVAARIVRVAAEFDRLANEDLLSPLEALEVLHRGAAYDFDPVVVASLRSTLEASRSLASR